MMIHTGLKSRVGMMCECVKILQYFRSAAGTCFYLVEPTEPRFCLVRITSRSILDLSDSVLMTCFLFYVSVAVLFTGLRGNVGSRGMSM
jgi:hypothetical protein